MVCEFYLNKVVLKNLKDKNRSLFLKSCIANTLLQSGNTQILLILCQVVDSEEMDTECKDIL